MPAVITFDFDPLLFVDDISIRLQTVAIAAIIFATLILLARIGQLTALPGPYVPPQTLRAAELPFLILGIVPGAVLGGRLDYVLVHLDYYLDHPGQILDPSQGALGLGLAVPGAILGGVWIGELMNVHTDKWMHASTLPALLALAAGKFSGVLSAEGQGRPSDLPWATAYVGDGPWSSLAAYIPSQPSQVYEALATLVVLALVATLIRLGAFARRDGQALLFGVGLWAIGRAFVVLTWRDATVLGPLRAEQLVLGSVVAVAVALVVRFRTREVIG